MSAVAVTNHRIFWAEDDVDDMEVFRDIVQERASDHKLVDFRNGEQLLKQLSDLNGAEHPCIIVLDINMPVMGGLETLRQLKQCSSTTSIPVVMFTTSISPAAKDVCDGYNVKMITKPSTYPDLIDSIEGILSMCGRRLQP